MDTLTDMEKRHNHIAGDLAQSPILQAKPGDTVKALMEYNFEVGLVVSVGRKNLKLNVGGYETAVAKEKCATLNESVAVVWETWRGNNGRGGYRLERSMYPAERVKARLVGRQSVGEGRITEKNYPAFDSSCEPLSQDAVAIHHTNLKP